MSRTLVRVGVAWAGICLVVAWLVFDLDVFWLAMGGGLVIGNLLAWVLASSGTRQFEPLLRRLSLGSMACLGVSFVLLRNAFLTFFFFGGIIAFWIHLSAFHWERIRKSRPDGA